MKLIRYVEFYERDVAIHCQESDSMLPSKYKVSQFELNIGFKTSEHLKSMLNKQFLKCAFSVQKRENVKKSHLHAF